MAGPMPGLLSLVEELYGRINKERLFGGGVRGAATRGLLGAQPAEDMTPTQRDVYENAVRISAPAQGLTALKAATVFHGSPAKFKRFDPTKIGSGEGAQVYGYGHYVAENPAVAKDYQKTLAYKAFDLQPEAEKRGVSLSAGAKGEFIRQAQTNEDPAVLARRLQNANISAREIPADKLEDLFRAYKEQGGGSLYKIDLPDEQIARMLDWDKPLSQQPENVRAAFYLDKFPNASIKDLKGYEAYVKLGEMLGEPTSQSSKAAEHLRGKGIPGIRYLDQGSRSKFLVQNLYKGQPYGEPVSFMTELQAKEYAAEQVKKGFDTKMLPGTSNFVVFPGEEELLRILERNGVPITSLLD